MDLVAASAQGTEATEGREDRFVGGASSELDLAQFPGLEANQARRGARDDDRRRLPARGGQRAATSRESVSGEHVAVPVDDGDGLVRRCP
jgi:hypothetical protein